ncbi:MAG: hypothetical protein ACYDIC_13600 [Desulfobaccales bacterium]
MLLQVLPAAAQSGAFPWKAGDAAPPVAGIHLGDDRQRLNAILGKPSETQKLGDDVWAFTYQKRGVQVLYTPLDGAAIIYLLNRAAGDIGGVRLGDAQEDVLARWGEPSLVQGETALYRAGDWVVVLKLDQRDKVKQLGLGRAADKKEGTYYRKKD